MKKIICIGSSTQDIFFPTNEGKIIETPEEIDLCHECTGCGLHFENTPQ